MITRRKIFVFNADLWDLVDQAASAPAPADERTRDIVMLIAALAIYRGRWFGTVLWWAFAAIVRATEAALAIVPLPTKVLDTRDGFIVTRVKWLCWYFLWGLELPIPPLPAEIDARLPRMEIADASATDLYLWFLEDIFQTKRADGSILDVGWTPAGRDGEFICLIVADPALDDAWTSPKEYFTTKSTAKMRAWVAERL